MVLPAKIRSEEFELRSHVQEILYYFKNHTDQDIKDNRIYKLYDEMEKFNAEKFYNNLLNIIIQENFSSDAEYIMDRLRDNFLNTYEKVCIKYNLKHIIPIDYLKGLNCLDFILWWEPQFNKKGNYVKRKFYKLKSGMDKFKNNNDNNE